MQIIKGKVDNVEDATIQEKPTVQIAINGKHVIIANLTRSTPPVEQGDEVSLVVLEEDSGQLVCYSMNNETQDVGFQGLHEVRGMILGANITIAVGILLLPIIVGIIPLRMGLNMRKNMKLVETGAMQIFNQ